jgi:hypothetical protein
MKGSELVCNIGRFIPCLFIGGIVGWSYYAMTKFIFLDYYRQNYSTDMLVFLMLVYNFVTVMFIWSWLRTVLTKPATCDHRFMLNRQELEHFILLQNYTDRDKFLKGLIDNRQLVVKERVDQGRASSRDTIRFCRKSQCIKPDRSHYDSMTKQLVLKMDHYCPWVANCIGYSNYKYFVMFLFYAIVYCFCIMGLTLHPFLQVWTSNGNSSDSSFTSSFRLQSMFVFMAASIFSLSLAFLFSMHLYLISTNRTTIELYSAPVIENLGGLKHAYNISCLKNWKQVCGENVLLWFFPVKTNPEECDGGHKFPLNDKVYRTTIDV